MIELTKKDNCSACSACFACCPQHCISMRKDKEGFSYPHVNKSDCINCGLCEKVCPYMHDKEGKDPICTYAAYHHQDSIVKQSTSGGIFSLLAQQIISDGGVVFGARFDNKWQVIVDYTDCLEGVSVFQGSKYVQADTNYSYSQVELFLKQGRKVLYSGTPCQIAGLKGFLRKEYENLLTVEVACDGVPSPKVWYSYLKEKTHDSIDGITDIKFRYKPQGWKGYRLMVELEGQKLSVPRSEDPYIQGFIQGLTTRPSCIDCQFRNGKSQADITLADFWGVERLKPEMDNKNGISLVIVRTENGTKYFPNQHAKYTKVDLSQAILFNDGLREHHHCHRNRTRFFDELDNTVHFTQLVKTMLAPTLGERIQALPLRMREYVARIYHKIR